MMQRLIPLSGVAFLLAHSAVEAQGSWSQKTCPLEVSRTTPKCNDGSDAWYYEYTEYTTGTPKTSHSPLYKSAERAVKAKEGHYRMCQATEQFFRKRNCRIAYGGVFCAACGRKMPDTSPAVEDAKESIRRLLDRYHTMLKRSIRLYAGLSRRRDVVKSGDLLREYGREVGEAERRAQRLGEYLTRLTFGSDNLFGGVMFGGMAPELPEDLQFQLGKLESHVNAANNLYKMLAAQLPEGKVCKLSGVLLCDVALQTMNSDDEVNRQLRIQRTPPGPISEAALAALEETGLIEKKPVPNKMPELPQSKPANIVPEKQPAVPATPKTAPARTKKPPLTEAEVRSVLGTFWNYSLEVCVHADSCEGVKVVVRVREFYLLVSYDFRSGPRPLVFSEDSFDYSDRYPSRVFPSLDECPVRVYKDGSPLHGSGLTVAQVCGNSPLLRWYAASEQQALEVAKRIAALVESSRRGQ